MNNYLYPIIFFTILVALSFFIPKSKGEIDFKVQQEIFKECVNTLPTENGFFKEDQLLACKEIARELATVK